MPPSRLIPNLVYGWTGMAYAGLKNGRITETGGRTLSADAMFHLEDSLLQTISARASGAGPTTMDFEVRTLLDTRPTRIEL